MRVGWVLLPLTWVLQHRPGFARKFRVIWKLGLYRCKIIFFLDLIHQRNLSPKCSKKTIICKLFCELNMSKYAYMFASTEWKL